MPRTRQREVQKLEVPPGDELLTIAEVADRLRVDDTTVRRWIKIGALEAVILPHMNKRAAYRVKKKVFDGVTKGQRLGASNV